MFAAGEFAMSIGTVSGSTRRAPFSLTVSQAVRVVQMPPIPEPTTTPSRSPSTSGLPASAHASRAATMAYCAEGSRRRVSWRVSTASGETATWPAKLTGSS